MLDVSIMKLKTFFVVFAFLNLSFCGNIFYEKLNKLLDYCLKYQDTVNAGTLLGIFFAKGQILSVKDEPENAILINKCEKLQNYKEIAESNLNEIGD